MRQPETVGPVGLELWKLGPGCAYTSTRQASGTPERDAQKSKAVKLETTASAEAPSILGFTQDESQDAPVACNMCSGGSMV